MTTGERIRARRKALGLTQKQLADAARVNRVQIVKIEADESDFRRSTIEAIAEALRTTVGKLVRRDE